MNLINFGVNNKTFFPSHQCQTGSKNLSSEDHYSIAHSAPKRRKNEFGLPQSVNLTKLPTPSEFTHSERNKPSYYRGPRLEQSPDLGLELDMENIKDVHNKEQGLMVMGDRERKFSDSSGSSPSTSVSCSPKVCDCPYLRLSSYILFLLTA